MPCAAARREVAKVCAGEPDGDGGTMPLDKGKGKERASSGSSGNGEVGEKGWAEAGGRTGEENIQEDSDSDSSSRNAPDGGGCGDVDPVRSEQGPAPRTVPGVGVGVGGDGVSAGGGGSGQEGGGKARCWWDTVRARLVRGGGFTECAAENLLARLEWAGEQEDDDDDGVGVFGEDGGTAESAVGTGGGEADAALDGGSSSGSGGNGSGCGRRRRMLRHLEATRALCEEWGLLAGVGHAGSGGGGGGGSGGGGSWSGWEAFGLAVATSASRDRLSLCCWAVRPLLGVDACDGDSGSRKEGRRRSGPLCPGLPRGEVIELLCLMLCALRSLEGEGGGGVGGGGGIVRLKADLLVCARVLENWDVR